MAFPSPSDMVEIAEAKLLELLVKPKGKIGTVELHATVREEHTFRSKATSHPVEAEPGDASEISDNIKADPVRIRIEGVVTNTPSISERGVEKLVTGKGTTTTSDYDPAGDAYGDFVDMIMNAKEVEVVTSLNTYSNMVFETFVVDRAASKANSIHFSAALSQIKKVQLEEQQIRVKLPTKAQKAKGKKPVQTAKPEAEEKMSFVYKGSVDEGWYSRVKTLVGQ